MQIRQIIPWWMAAVRTALGPVILIGERCNWSGSGLAALVITALVSDIFDGILARRWKCDTAGLRLFDSMADTVFYLFVALALWTGPSAALRENAPLLLALLGLEATRYVVDLAKFGKPASYHSWLAKSWGLVMAVAVLAAFATSGGALLIRLSLFLGLLCNAEGLAMSFILPRWTRDVTSITAALGLRRAQVHESARAPRARPLLT
ncbi:MAG TPA: CDP-alcohol phosphatidyltransferase family protein [Acidobacteriaceae bacterium]|nr:CDP-alcohol phosphatidyltransferase family protein [Acidobacteriaceae bacterium]